MVIYVYGCHVRVMATLATAVPQQSILPWLMAMGDPQSEDRRDALCINWWAAWLQLRRQYANLRCVHVYMVQISCFHVPARPRCAYACCGRCFACIHTSTMHIVPCIYGARRHPSFSLCVGSIYIVSRNSPMPLQVNN